MKESEREADEFWDISRLVPKKKEPLAPFSTKPKLTLFTDGTTGGESSSGASPLTFPARTGTFREETYVPDRNRFLKRITVRHRVDGYDFYENFRRAALLYYDVKGSECPFDSNYSYMPQYAQMTKEQKNYYFYWRSELRAGCYAKTEPSYIYLYVYEILNLPDKIPPVSGLSLLCDVWRAYRKTHPTIDRYFSVWVQDYCMVHKLPSPGHLIADFLFEAVAASGFREFYLSDFDGESGVGTEGLLAYLSDYDWRTGRYAGGESRAVYETCMERTLGAFLTELFRRGDLFSENAASAVIRREAFPCSLCTHSVKCSLEIEYYPLGESTELRALVTGAVKHTENRLRAAMGVKSRLSVKNFPEDAARLADRIFDDLFAAHKKKSAASALPEYEKLYDTGSETLSSEDAETIERASWDTTLRLVDEEEARELLSSNIEKEGKAHPEDTRTPAPEKTPSDIGHATGAPVAAEPSSPRQAKSHFGLSRAACDFLRAVYEGDEGAKKAAVAASGGLAEGLIEQINEAFSEHFGDIVIDYDGAVAVPIEDYREDIESWLKK